MNKFILNNIPKSPGVYLHKDDQDKIIYIGKAKDLKKRVSSYFSLKVQDIKTSVLVKHISSIDFIATNNEMEALLLENSLIKKHKPRYNIQLKDSIRYHYIQVTKEDFPRILISRNHNCRDIFFGPYISSMFDIVKLIRNIFKFRACKPGKHKRPCLYYQIGMCSGPCGNLISQEEYNENVNAAIKFLRSGDNDKIIEELETLMFESSKNEDYEKALDCRKKIFLLNQIRQRQIVSSENKQDQDALAIATSGDKSAISILKLKKGVIVKKEDFIFLYSDELLDEFLKTYYIKYSAPNEILVDNIFDSNIENYLSDYWKKKISIIRPLKGKKFDLVNLARKNAYMQFQVEDSVLIELKELLGLEDIPSVIDCFDISNYGDSVIVGACVQYKNKQPNKQAWRLYNIQGQFGQDDFRAIHEVIKRRYFKEALPDLIVIDGGHIQVDFALKALRELGLNCIVIGLAKKEETIVFPEGNTLKLNEKLESAKLLMRIRDAVHNFAINHSRRSFRKHYKKSELDNILGIGDATKFLLLQEFGSLEQIKKINLEDLSLKIGFKKAKLVYTYFNSSK